MLGPLRSMEEQRHDQQLKEIQLRRQERERRAAEEDGGARDDSPPIQEKADELTGPFHYDFSYWARSVPLHFEVGTLCSLQYNKVRSCDENGPHAHTSAQCLAAKQDELLVLEVFSDNVMIL